MENLQVLTLVLPVYQSLIFSGLAFMMYLRGEGYHRFALGLFMLGNALLFAIQGIWNLGYSWAKLPAFVLSLPVWLLQLPLFYFFLKSVLEPGFTISKSDTKHFMASILSLLLMLFFALQPAEHRNAYLAGEGPQNLPLRIFRFFYWGSVYGGIYVQFLIYLWYSYRRYPVYLKNILNYYSNPEQYSLTWSRWILFLFVLFYLLFDVLHLVKIPTGSLAYKEFTLLLIFINFSLGFFGLSQPDTWFEHKFHQPDMLPPKEIEVDEKRGAGVAEGELEEITYPAEPQEVNETEDTLSRVLEGLMIQAEKVMLEEKPWVNPEFNIAMLSSILNSNSKYVSKAINGLAGMTFSQWVNMYRIREVEKYLLSKDYNHFSLDGLYQQVGFRNRNTFLNAFKKVHGTTPTQFRKQNLEEDSMNEVNHADPHEQS